MPDPTANATVNPRKWTTKVNIAVVIGVLVVLIIGFSFVLWARESPGEVREQVDREVDRVTPPPNPSAPADE